MKHSWKITAILLSMFVVAQLIGLFVINAYTPDVKIVDGVETEVHQLPYGTAPPSDVTPGSALISILIAIVIAVTLIFFLMRFNAEIFLRLWFFVVVTLAIGIAVNSILLKIINGHLIALAIALPIAYFKIFKRNIIVHNASELLIYPGIAAIFVPLVNIWAAVVLLILISLYDAYAVWKAGFMQKMAKYQIEKLRFFAGFFLPKLSDKQKLELKKAKNSGKLLKQKKIKVSVAVLGGGDVAFPLILAGVVLRALGIIPALIIVAGAASALGYLLLTADKKPYPAMPYITTGCLVALGVIYLIG